MSKLLEDAIRKVRALPESEQDEAAEFLLAITARHRELRRLDSDTRAAVKEGLAQANGRDFVSDADMAAFFARHGVKPRGT